MQLHYRHDTTDSAQAAILHNYKSTPSFYFPHCFLFLKQKQKKRTHSSRCVYFISRTFHLRFPAYNASKETTHSFRNPMTSLLFHGGLFNVFYFAFGTGPRRPFLFTADERKRKFVFKWPKLFRRNLIMLLLA